MDKKTAIDRLTNRTLHNNPGWIYSKVTVETMKSTVEMLLNPDSDLEAFWLGLGSIDKNRICDHISEALYWRQYPTGYELLMEMHPTGTSLIEKGLLQEIVRWYNLPTSIEVTAAYVVIEDGDYKRIYVTESVTPLAQDTKYRRIK